MNHDPINRARSSRTTLPGYLGIYSILVLVGILGFPGSGTGNAQSTPSSSDARLPGATSQLPGSIPSADDRYRIGPGDVLDIRVFNKPQFSRDGVRVNGRGMIRMPFIENDIRAACKTEAELAKELGALFLDYLKAPQVDVFIKEYASQPVAILGAVRSPSRFQLQRRVKLLELISFAGGPSDNAGRVIQVVHTVGATSCEGQSMVVGNQSEQGELDSFALAATLRGDEPSNPFVRPGDIVTVAVADQAYVIGNVLRPQPIPLREPVTVSKAIAMSGGTLPDTKADKVRIIRQDPVSGAKSEILVDLRGIEKLQANDPELRAGDILEIPTSSGKRFLRTMLGGVSTSAAQLPIRIIP